MGTKLGNLHIRNATVEEVAPLLPGAIVGQWADGFVSAYAEEYQWGSVERSGKKLSRKLPAATVLTAAIFDSDVVSFEVYEAGKRLTAHLLNPYEDVNRPGNPKVFCEALGLPPEDEKRLRILWKKGDAEDQLELTGSLLGLPLYHDPAYMPKESVRRDVAAVDAWIAERPAPPRIKSVTKAELVQEIPGKKVIYLIPNRKDLNRKCPFRLIPSQGENIAGETKIMEHSPELAPGDWSIVEEALEPDAYGIAKSQDRLYVRRNENAPKGSFFHFFCYDREGALRGEQRLPWNTELIALDQEGGLWMGENSGRIVVHLDKNLNILARSPVLTSERDFHVLDMDISKDGETVFLTSFQMGLFVLDAKDLSILQAKMTRDMVCEATIDGQGRFWACVSDSTLEAYDRNLTTISRHRLKGAIIGLHRNDGGELMAYTHDDKRNIFRIYRIS